MYTSSISLSSTNLLAFIYFSVGIYLLIYKYRRRIILIMAQALLNIFANANDRTMLEDGEIPNTAWSGDNVETRHISQNTFGLIDRDFERLLLIGMCTFEGCQFSNPNKLCLQHVESHYLKGLCAI